MPRLLIIMGMMILTLLLVQEFSFSPDAYFAMQVENVSGRPYLLVQYQSSEQEQGTPYLSLYTPKGDAPAEWEPLMVDRQGPSYGSFTARALSTISPDTVRNFAAITGAALARRNFDPRLTGLETLADVVPEARYDERLGLFHPELTTLLDTSKRPLGMSFSALPFKWAAETAADIKGVTYAFGVDAVRPTDDSVATIKGKLKVARFNGTAWELLKVEGPEVEFGRIGFLLKAVATGDTVRVLWRDMDSDQILASNVEGLRVVTTGNAHIATFNGTDFEKQVESVNGLPRGNICAWSEGPEFRMLIQTRGNADEGPASSGVMEIWGVLPGNPPVKIETVGGEGSRGGMLAYIAAERLVMNGQEYILRSNWQKFELWKRESPTSWKLAAPTVKGLPVYNVEGMLLTSMFVVLALLAFSAGVAWRRRAIMPGQKIHSRAIFATMGARMGSYAIDLILIFVTVYVLSQARGLAYISPIELLQMDLSRSRWPFFLIYIFYLSLTEWLIGASLGKYLMGLRVIRANGTRLTLWAALVRNLTGFFERMPQVVLVPMFMMIFSPYRQRLGDLFGRTIVVHKATLEAFKAQQAAELAAKKAAGDSGTPSLDSLVGVGSGDENKLRGKDDVFRGPPK